MSNTKPILITLTAPTCSGKSYLLNYIREVAKLPCLVSTTTRQPRAGEVEGVDYFFISEEVSRELERRDQFAELAIYNAIRYGVTKKEFHEKLDKGVAFLIVEPSGIDHYVKPALDAGAIHMSYFVNTPIEIRTDRFKKRILKDLQEQLQRVTDSRQDLFSILQNAHVDEFQFRLDKYLGISTIVESSLKRLKTMMTVENEWKDFHKWTNILSGDETPWKNVEIILADIARVNGLVNIDNMRK